MIAQASRFVSTPTPAAENIVKNDYTYYTCCCWCGNEEQCSYLLKKGRQYAESMCDRCATRFLEPDPFDWVTDGF